VWRGRRGAVSFFFFFFFFFFLFVLLVVVLWVCMCVCFCLFFLLEVLSEEAELFLCLLHVVDQLLNLHDLCVCVFVCVFRGSKCVSECI
jgi:hypothetical protein